MRFILASVVALGHFHLLEWFYAASLAVSVFLALSGWLIGGILLRTTRAELPRFFFNRATRIWIPYLAAMIALYALSALREPITASWLEYLFYDVTFTHNWFAQLPGMPMHGTGSHFWSIAVEEQFYLAAPLLMIFARFGKTPAFWAIIASLLCVSEPHFAAIALGVLAATLRARFGDWHRKAAAVAALLALALASVTLMISGWHVEHTAPFFAVATVLLAARPGTRTAAGMFLGAVSYPLYLNHWMGGFVAHGLLKRTGSASSLLEGLLAFPLAFAAGVVAYLLIDKQVMARRNAWFSPSRGRTLGLVAYTLVGVGLTIGLTLAARR